MKVRFRIDKDLCIPAMACIVAEPELYELDDSGKADVKKQLTLEGMQELVRDGDWVEVNTDEKGFERIVESARVCPVLAIFVEKEENGNWVRVYPQ
jgi:ferredoxin